jgi:hypothetical protein
MLAPVHAVGEAVVHAFEADDLVALGERARESRRVEHGLGAGVAQAHHVHARDRVDDLLRKTRFVFGRQREHGAAVLDEIDDGLRHALRAVAEDHRAEAEQVVDVLVAIDVGEMRTLTLVDEQRIWIPARPGRTRGAVDAAGNQLARGAEQFAAAMRVEAGDEGFCDWSVFKDAAPEVDRSRAIGGSEVSKKTPTHAAPALEAVSRQAACSAGSGATWPCAASSPASSVGNRSSASAKLAIGT